MKGVVIRNVDSPMSEAWGLGSQLLDRGLRYFNFPHLFGTAGDSSTLCILQ